MRIFILGFILTFTALSQGQTTNSSSPEAQHVYDAPIRGQCFPNPQLCYYCSKLHNCAECIQDPDNCCYKPDYRLNEKGLTRKAIFLIKKLCSKRMASPKIIKKHCLARMKLNPFLNPNSGRFSEDVEAASTVENGVTESTDNMNSARGVTAVANSADDATNTASTTTQDMTSTAVPNLDDDLGNTSIETDEINSTTGESSSTTTSSPASTTDMQQASVEDAEITSETTSSMIPEINTENPAVTTTLTTEDIVTEGNSVSEETMNSAESTQELQVEGISATSTENPSSSTSSIMASTQFADSTMDGSESIQTASMTPGTDSQTESVDEMETTYAYSSPMPSSGMTTLELDVNLSTTTSQSLNDNSDLTEQSTGTSSEMLATTVSPAESSTSIPETNVSTREAQPRSKTSSENKVSPVKAEISNNCKSICVKSIRAQKCAKCVMDNRMCCFGIETGSFVMASAQYQAAKSLCFH